MAWKIRDLMTPDPVTVEAGTDFKTCVELLRSHRIGSLPVVAGDRLLGILSESDLLRREESRTPAAGSRVRRPRPARSAGEAMTAPALTVGPEASLPEAARLMHSQHVHQLPVCDPSGRLLGIVTRTDLLRPFLRSDESIRREISEILLHRTLAIDPDAVAVEVHSGLVRLAGEVESRSLAALTGRLAGQIEGVVDVENLLTYRLDDEHLRPELPPRALQLTAQERL